MDPNPDASPPSTTPATPPTIKLLTSRLLELRRHGRPPFLVRNLRYVAQHKARARRLHWDLHWATPTSTNAERHLVLHVRPHRCFLRRGIAQQLLHPAESLPDLVRDAYVPLEAKCRIWLSVLQQDASFVCFGLRNVDVRVWPEEHRNALEIVDFPVRETFDLSAAIALIGSFPAALTLIVEVFSDDPAAKLVNQKVAKLRGECRLMDSDVSDTTIFPNGRVTVPLYFVPTEVGEVPATSSRPAMGFDPAVYLQQERVLRGEDGGVGEEEEDDVIMDDGVQEGEMGDVEEITPVRTRDRSEGKPGDVAPEKMRRKEDGTRKRKMRKRQGQITLDLEGTMQNAVQQLCSSEKPRIHITCWYTSKELPYWDGIVRHDFICPWCHRNCRRLRTLLGHFQVDHDDMFFALEGLDTGAGNRGDGARVPFVLNFKVAAAEQGGGEDGIGREGGLEEVFANPVRFPSYMATVSGKEGQEEVAAAMGRVRISDRGGGETDSDNDAEFLDAMRKEIWNVCKVCQRRYDEPSEENAARGDFCSEFCESVYKVKFAEGTEEGDLPSLASLSSRPRPKKVNYQEAFGKLQLYHVVSVCKAKEEHYDEDDPDSEEEVDQSWRLDLALERVRHMEEANPKEKLLYMMWNKYAQENYPIPSFYAERYTRYTLELFVLEYGPQIKQLKLRLQLVGFLRALHTHGMIDSEAIRSVMECLDGKKKRRDCKTSSRPDISLHAQQRLSRGGGSGRGRRGRRRA